MKSIFAMAVVLMGAGFGTVQSAQACFSPISQRDLWVVNVADQRTIDAQTGDMVTMDVVLPLIPSTAKAKTVASFDKDVLRLVAQVPGNLKNRGVGVMVRTFIFEVVGAGRTTIELDTYNNGKLIESAKQDVDAKARPVSRCM